MLAKTARQLAALEDPHHPRQISRIYGVRQDLRWEAPGVRQSKGEGRPGMDALDLVRAVESMRIRRGRAMVPNDAATLIELHLRCFGFRELTRRRFMSIPQWLPRLLPGRRLGGYQRFVSALLDAYRVGAVGIVMSYEEAQALFDVRSRDTWRRWCAELEEAGMVRIVQTWAEDRSGSTRPRRRDRLFYRIGPTLEEAVGPGLLEGARGLSDTQQRWAERAAMGARAKARAEIREAKADHWRAMREKPATKEEISAKPTVEPSPTPPKMDTEQSISPTCSDVAKPSDSGAHGLSAVSPVVRQSDPTPPPSTGANSPPLSGRTQGTKALRAVPSGPVFQHAPRDQRDDVDNRDRPPAQPEPTAPPTTAARPLPIPQTGDPPREMRLDGGCENRAERARAAEAQPRAGAPPPISRAARRARKRNELFADLLARISDDGTTDPAWSRACGSYLEADDDENPGDSG